jgi:hypothetical protein
VQEACQQRVHTLGDLLVTLDDATVICAMCGVPMHVQKTRGRTGVTLAHGAFHLTETVQVCPSGCRHADRPVTHRSPAIAAILPPGSVVGYDVMVAVGIARFVQHQQREETRATLIREHGVVLSTGEISRLAHRFLAYLQALHTACAPALRAALAADGGWPLHLDATGEDGRGTLVVAYAGWRRWVLGAWKVPTERAAFILPGIHEVADAFGAPCAIMRDLGRAMAEAAHDYVGSLPQPIAILACHYHFLADIGTDLLATGHEQLRALFRHANIVPRLRAFVRQHGDRLGSPITEGRDGVGRWLAEPHTGHRIPEGRAGQTVVRSVAQWILDYRADLTDAGFPFEVPALALYDRCLQVGAALRAFLSDPPLDPRVHKSLDRLQQILRPVDCAVPPFAAVSTALSRRVDLFAALRDALRLHGGGPIPAGETPREAAQTLRDIRTAVATLEASLRARRPARGPETDLRRAIDVILAHLQRHGPHLWGHVITATVGDETGLRVVDRTNDCLESFFHGMKHGERRRSGRKILTQDFERLPAAAALAVNLTRADYVEIVCGGSLGRLPAAFARLDAGNRSRSIAAAPREPLPIETASLSSTDRRLVRIPAMTARITAAAQAG